MTAAISSPARKAFASHFPASPYRKANDHPKRCSRRVFGVAPQGIHTILESNCKIVGTGDFDDDGNPDVLWQHRVSRQVAIWYMDGPHPQDSRYASMVEDRNWKVARVGDLDNDGNTDVTWQHALSGDIGVSLMNIELLFTAV
ncbi:MAG: VCBS repeat-containing protein [Rubrivivax sp.]|nr:VCBS repeat-containing protein [Rubrivivax sp.]